LSASIGIRREDKNRWERRTPLTPKDIAKMIRDEELHFIVQPSPIRIHKDDAFTHAGAELSEDLGGADVIFAVKEIPLDLLEENKTYIFFSHVIKGQDYNMPLLQRLLDLRCTLVDYERIADDAGRRLVFFGKQAGQAGMIETLHALGRRLEWEDYSSPFRGVKPAYHYRDLEHAKSELQEQGLSVRSGLDPDLCPMVFGFAGYGNVSLGAQEIFDLYPHEEIEPGELEDLFRRKSPPRDRLFKVVFKEEHLVQPHLPGAEFELQDYYANPENYRSVFGSYLPALTALVNCIYWTEKYPRLIDKEQARLLWIAGTRTLRVIGDISCDIDGSIEFTHKATEPDAASFVYDPISGQTRDGHTGRGIVVMSVDNLPCEISRDASDHFSSSLRDFVPALARADYSVSFANLALPSALKRAVITYQGRLTPDFRYLDEFLPES
jgi:alanine dehydrogenase